MTTDDSGNRKLTDSEYAAANPPRAQVLQEAERLITGDRNLAYGSPTQNFTNIAEMWTTRLRHKLKPDETITATDVADAMMLLKIARNISQRKRDNYADLAGYAGCGYEAMLEEEKTPQVNNEQTFNVSVNLPPNAGTAASDIVRELTKEQRRLGLR